jgi:hypothetical protein
MTTVNVVATASPEEPLTGFQQLTVANSAVALTVPTGAITAHCRLETAQIRFTLDGTTPTTTVGTLLNIDECLVLENRGELTGFQAIRTGGTSGLLNVEYAGRATP